MTITPNKKLIASSPFSNTYGGLKLFKGSDGQNNLEMEDCRGPTYWGPLSREQVKAFHVLSAAPIHS
ncbi:hypothetical protein [Pseudomonas sp. MWU12-2323]|uniref:hypothetical protein n=1 Tax=Pseudomonas sp. MWU12-2323 TaxID=2651296 RepID=UPI00128C85E2|nr:hypothetical protein [Pseudomonas sp. MWU12-2323]MPQ69478.1 hypothetical protein [Pseudomonas sp. MWU12-2323]